MNLLHARHVEFAGAEAVPRSVFASATFASQLSLPGTENFCFIALVAAPDVAPPTIVRTIQKPMTRRLWRSTQEVTLEIINRFYHKRLTDQVK